VGSWPWGRGVAVDDSHRCALRRGGAGRGRLEEDILCLSGRGVGVLRGAGAQVAEKTGAARRRPGRWPLGTSPGNLWEWVKSRED
jgi:hypothetical protein